MTLIPSDASLVLAPAHTSESALAAMIKRREGNGKLDRLSKRAVRAAAAELLSSLGIDDPEAFLLRRTDELGAGHRQLLSAALALAPHPTLLVADEPAHSLDRIARSSLVLALRTAAEHGAALVVFTKDGEFAAEIADRCHGLEQGRLVAWTEPKPEAASVLPREPARSAAPGLSERAEPLLVAEHLSRAYLCSRRSRTSDDLVRAVSEVSLRVRRGECVGVLGENASGKSVLGRLLLRLERPSYGRLWFRNDEITDAADALLGPLRRSISWLPEDPHTAFDPELPIDEQLHEALAAQRDLGESERTARLESWADKLLVPREALLRLPTAVSSSELMLAAAIRALACEPDGIVCDASFCVLDPAARQRLLLALRELAHTRGTACVLATPDATLLRDFCHRVIVLLEGRIVEAGSAERVLGQPAHPYTQALASAREAFVRTDLAELAEPREQSEPREQRDALPGLDTTRQGCAYLGRCPFAEHERCDSAVPDLALLSHGQRVACFVAVDRARAAAR
jgi:oligopeptide/dipeptide ABC transporter ATP-binding protein